MTVPSESRRGRRAKREPLGEQVTARIRELILTGELEPGDRIGQEALASLSGTSRIPGSNSRSPSTGT